MWRAADEMLDRQVAVKEMRIDGLDAEDTRTRRERTLREARATARIDHPNVVRIYDVVDEGERLWIVMELVAGRSLEQIVVRDGPLDEREAARIGLELVAALRQVHAGGVLHRDIKPGNVLVEHQGHRRVVLTDFGIAALQDAEALTMVGMLVGSPDYMAPERISGRPQGPPSDVWSLGATLCAALGGRSPFSRSTTLATLHAVLYEEPELPEAADDLRYVLAALLDKEPDARPGLEELEAALGRIVRSAYDVGHDAGFASREEPVPGTTPVPEAGSGPDRTSAPGSGQRPGAGPASATARGPEFETVPEYDFEPGAVAGPDPTLVAGPDTFGPGPDVTSGPGPVAASGSGARADLVPEPDAALVAGSDPDPVPDAVSMSDTDADTYTYTDAVTDSDTVTDSDSDTVTDAATESGPDLAPDSGPSAGQAQQPSAGPVPASAAERPVGRDPAPAAEVAAGSAPAPAAEVSADPPAEPVAEPVPEPPVPPVPGPAEGESSSPPEPGRDAPEAVPPAPGPVPPTREEPAHDTHDIRGTRRIPRERPTPALLDAQLIRAARQHPSDLPEATPPPVHDAVPVRRTPTPKSSLDFTKPPSERPPAEAPAPAPVPDPTPVPEPSSHSEARNASTEVPSELRAEPGSEIPSVGVHQASARAVTEAALPTAPSPGGMPPGEFPGSAVPSGSGTAGGTRRGGRHVGLLAAGGVAAAGLVVWIVVAASGGPSGDRTGASGSSGPAVTAGGNGGPSPRTSSSPTVEGTSRPPSLPPGAHREAGGYAWATPKGWRRDVKTGSEVHYTSPDGTQELAAKSSLAKGDLMDTWQTSERNAREGRDYRKIRLEETVFQGRPAVVWEYTFTLKGEHWHARLLGFDESGKSYQINTWYQPGIEAQALGTYDKVKDSFTVL
ncbi:serine/threonine protein kinase [Streptomyces sp. Tue6028]|uniref:serine/threonine protein kinase n=1 Tax=Streptomyces sp. Tue6028 TaxID=2036037 RepID=UPI00267A7021